MKDQKFTLAEGTLVFITPLERDGDTTAVRGEVVESTDQYVVVDYVDNVCAPTGSMVQIGFQSKQRFATAPARVGQLLQSTPSCRIRFNLADSFKADDHRDSFRVTVAGALVNAKINGDEECTMLDVSSNGLSILSECDYKRGLVLEVSFTFDAKEYSGRAIIRNVAQAKKDRNRLGLEVVKGEQQLLAGLQHLSISVQREQIRRMRDKGMRAA